MVNLSLALKNLTRHRLRTILSVAGVGIAFSAFLLMSSLSPSLLNLAGPGGKSLIILAAYVILIVPGLMIAYFLTKANFAERTYEIALLRAVGWGRTKVLFLLAAEGFWIAFIGGLIGIILSFPAAYIVPLLNFAPIAITFEIAIGGLTRSFFLLAALGVAGALAPAYRASGIPPVEITYE